jgi:hypothetical protein
MNKFNVDDFYGAEKYPKTLFDIHRDFSAFMKLNWVTLDDRSDFIEWATREFKIDVNNKFEKMRYFGEPVAIDINA